MFMPLPPCVVRKPQLDEKVAHMEATFEEVLLDGIWQQ